MSDAYTETEPYPPAVLAGQIGRAIVAANRVREDGPLRPFVEQLYAIDPPLPRVRGTGVPAALRLAGANEVPL